MALGWAYRAEQGETLGYLAPHPSSNWSLSGMRTKVSKPTETVALTLNSPPEPSRTRQRSESPISGSPTAKRGLFTTARSKEDSLLSSTQSGKESSGSSLPEEQTLVRFRRTSSGELMRQTTEGCWNAAVEQVDWSKIDATSDAEIERQEIADLVDVALQRQVGGLVALAERLHVSPSSVRRWRQARVMPSLVHRQRLHHLLKAL